MKTPLRALALLSSLFFSATSFASNLEDCLSVPAVNLSNLSTAALDRASNACAAATSDENLETPEATSAQSQLEAELTIRNKRVVSQEAADSNATAPPATALFQNHDGSCSSVERKNGYETVMVANVYPFCFAQEAKVESRLAVSHSPKRK